MGGRRGGELSCGGFKKISDLSSYFLSDVLLLYFSMSNQISCTEERVYVHGSYLGRYGLGSHLGWVGVTTKMLICLIYLPNLSGVANLSIPLL